MIIGYRINLSYKLMLLPHFVYTLCGLNYVLVPFIIVKLLLNGKIFLTEKVYLLMCVASEIYRFKKKMSKILLLWLCAVVFLPSKIVVGSKMEFVKNRTIRNLTNARKFTPNSGYTTLNRNVPPSHLKEIDEGLIYTRKKIYSDKDKEIKEVKVFMRKE